ncbi:MAG: glycosyltransferase family 1 protein [Saprospiraceae bacterium]
MKIGYDAKRLLNNKTGLGNYSRTLLNNLAHYYPNNSYFLFSPAVKLKEYINQFSKIGEVITPTKSNRFLYRSFGIKKDILSKNIDIYHGLSHELPRNISKIKCKKVVTIHDLIFKVHPKYFPYIDRTFYHLKCKHSINHADKIIAISNNTKTDIIKYYNVDPKKIKVIYQPCDSIYYKDNNKKEILKTIERLDLPSQYLLYVGSIEPRKNIKSILRAYSKLSKEPQIPLVLVGRGKKYLTQITNLIKELKLQDKVILRDDISTNDLPAIYSNAEILIYPSFYEGFGLPIVEAMLCRTPVITANTSSLKEAGGPASIYVDPYDTTAIKQAITSILEDKLLASKMIEDSYEYATAKFSIERSTRQTIEVYKSLI